MLQDYFLLLPLNVKAVAKRRMMTDKSLLFGLRWFYSQLRFSEVKLRELRKLRNQNSIY